MQNPSIKAVFLDVDGTLVSFKTHKVPASTVDAIKQLQAKGIKVIVSTGRSINSLDHISFIDFDGFITFNGGYCATTSGEVLFKRCLEEADIQAVLDYPAEKNLSFSLMSEKAITIWNVSDDVKAMYAQLGLPVPPLLDRNTLDAASVLQANIFIGPEEEETFMAETMPNSMATRWTHLFADVNPIGQSKKVGIDIFCKHFGIDVSETMAFGDGGNDITMLQHVAIGVAMGNANPEVKAIADYTTDEVDADGIANALKHFKVI